jgi:hypothetical protein
MDGSMMTADEIIEKLKTGHQLNNRGKGWWLSAPKRLGGGADAIEVDADLMNRLEADGTLEIELLTTSMRAKLPSDSNAKKG